VEFRETHPVSLTFKEAFGLLKYLPVCLLFSDIKGKIRGVCVDLWQVIITQLSRHIESGEPHHRKGHQEFAQVETLMYAIGKFLLVMQ
jgi:hypothetical protein